MPSPVTDSNYHQAIFADPNKTASYGSVDSSGNQMVVGPTAAGSPPTTNPVLVGGSDGTNTQQLGVGIFHNADNQAIAATQNGLLTGGVAQLINFLGNLDRQRETGQDGVAPIGISTGGAQFAMRFLTTCTGNLAAGTRTYTPAAMSGTIGGVAWSIQVGSVLTVDSSVSQETVLVTAVTSNAFTAVFAKAHNGSGTAFPISGFVYNQERDASGELDGATGSGMAVAAEYEFNGGGPNSGNYDRARNVQAKGLATATISSGSAQGATTLTLSGSPTGLQPGQQILLYDASFPASGHYEAGYVALNNPGTTTLLLASGQINNVTYTTVAYDSFSALGPGTSGFLSHGIGIEEEALWDPVSGKFYIARSATQDNAVGPNIVMESEAIVNAFVGNGLERARSVAGKQLVGTANLANKAQNGGNITLTAPGAAGQTSLTFSADPSIATLNSFKTPLQAGMALLLFTAGSPPTNVEQVFVLPTYTGGVTVPITTTAITHSATTDAAWESFGPQGPALTGFITTGMDLDVDAVYDPTTGMYYLGRSATADGCAAQNIVLYAAGLWNPATPGFDRQRTPTIFKTLAAQAVTQGTPVAVWSPSGKKFRLMGGMLSLSVAGAVILKDTSTTEFIRTCLMGAGVGMALPMVGNGYLSAASGNALYIDVTATGSVSGYLFGCEE